VCERQIEKARRPLFSKNFQKKKSRDFFEKETSAWYILVTEKSVFVCERESEKARRPLFSIFFQKKKSQDFVEKETSAWYILVTEKRVCLCERERAKKREGPFSQKNNNLEIFFDKKQSGDFFKKDTSAWYILVTEKRVYVCVRESEKARRPLPFSKKILGNTIWRFFQKRYQRVVYPRH